MREIGLIDGAALANILDDNESGLALAPLINKYLIGSTRIDSLTPLRNRVIGVTFRTLSAHTIDAIVIILAITVERVKVEHLIPTAGITVIIWAGSYLGGWLAVVATLGCDQGDQQEK